ncbi:trimethylamine-N-oxide reductase TorA [Vreelandella jeotgali]|uniref:trimethylamine-N-oxide reductase TorA n=1 Tax=Vreelandella jeotgali TaxID=553386 RepID=UPI00034D21B0|nr:trimethylamine-N-oxide reductase TorA [Halomonas jeotgali]
MSDKTDELKVISTAEVASPGRRRFLQGSVATMAASSLPLSTSLLSRGAQAQTGKQEIVSGCHWGVFKGVVEDGRAVEFKPWAKDPQPTPMLEGVRDSIYSASRIRYPMVRRAWLEQGPGADPAGRGDGDFVRVSWEKATELVANEITRVRNEHGPNSLFAGSYGWKSPGKLHNCRTLLSRMLNLTGGGFTSSIGDYSTGAAQVILPYVTGSIEVYEQCTTYPVLAENTDLMVFWGCNPMNNSQISWQVADHGAFAGFDQLKKAGVEVISVDPAKTETCEYFDGEWVAPKPQTDVALMLGIAHTLYSEDLHDQEFLDRYTSGFDDFKPYLIGETDGQPKDAEWAADISGIDAEKIRELARRFANSRTMLSLGYATQRQHHGEQSTWMLVTLACMLGQIGLPGGGYGLSYHYSSGGAPTHESPVLQSIGDAAGSGGGLSVENETGDSAIPVARLVETLLNPGGKMDFNGGTIDLPKIKMAYWAGGNPFAHHQDRNEMLEAWQTLDTFVVNDFQWTATARHADIVLPTTTTYERNDIEQVGDYALSHIVPMKKIVEPQFEARNDFDIFADIAGKLGKGREFTEGRTEMDWIRGFYEGAKIESRAKGMEMPVFGVFWESNEPLAFPLEDEQKHFVRHQDFREDPILNALGTATGKFEIYSRAVAEYDYDDCPPHPTWLEPIERLDGPTTVYPLAIASNHPHGRLHSQLCGTSFRETYAVQNREPCWMNPKDAGERDIQDGDVVRVYNNRGHILAGAVVTEDLMPGVIRIQEGGWFDPVNPREIGSLCRYGDVNNLTPGIATSKLSQANCGQTGVADVEKFTDDLPEVTVFSQPS